MVFKRRHSTWYEQLLFHYWFLFFVGFVGIVLFPSLVFHREPLAVLVQREVWLNSLIVNFAAFILSAVFLSRMRFYPGVQPFFWIFPSAIFAWGLSVSVLLFLREDFSRKVILLSFVMACILPILGYFLSRRLTTLKLALVPFGSATDVVESNRVDVRLLDKPSLGNIRYDGVVVDLRAKDMPAEWEAFLARCALARIPVYHYKHIFESLTGRVNIEHLSENIFGELQPPQGYAIFKRLIDLLLVVVSAPLWVPVMFITGIVVKLESSGPMFFIQDRVGQGGINFRVYKLRSMTTDSEKHGAQFAQKNDARVTRVGKFIRKTRLDEIPQFINVLKGDMSLIGPRPEQRVFVEQFEKEIPFYAYRHIVKPGITGWAQVTQGYAADAEDTKIKIEHDFYYIKHFSLWLDLLIVIKTIKTILTGFGAR